MSMSQAPSQKNNDLWIRAHLSCYMSFKVCWKSSNVTGVLFLASFCGDRQQSCIKFYLWGLQWTVAARFPFHRYPRSKHQIIPMCMFAGEFPVKYDTSHREKYGIVPRMNFGQGNHRKMVVLPTFEQSKPWLLKVCLRGYTTDLH